jgi:6-pyruvoyltetrahydropterin/6-carboxytetrahydropterin synthase
MSVTATRRLQYAIGHRVFGHEGKCRHLHGHNFVFYLTAEANKLDSIGRVIDFGVLKSNLGAWIEREWDHGLVLWKGDTEAITAARAIKDQKLYLLHTNPTAENLALFLLNHLGPQLLDDGCGVRLVKVTVHETENGIAEATL